MIVTEPTFAKLKRQAVTLNYHEVLFAAQVGVQRQTEAIASGRPDRFGCDPEDGWKIHVEGAAGELAFAKVMDRYWGGSFNTYRSGGDVGTVQVRTRSKSHYDLIIREDDNDQDAFVLVTGRVPRFVVVGWIIARDGKRPEFIHSHGNRQPAYFVPQSALRSIETMFQG